MHGNSEMQKINQTSAMPEKTDVHWSGRFSVAPMLDWTDRHCRYFLRLLSRNTLLYTEMVTTGAIIHGKGDYLAYSEEEHPVALQLGGSDPAALAQCAKLAEARGYDEINLNVGCPSDRVQNGMFGACLMGNAQLVADCVKAMRDVVSIPVTVKTRIGIDDQDSYEFLCDFINTVAVKVTCSYRQKTFNFPHFNSFITYDFSACVIACNDSISLTVIYTHKNIAGVISIWKINLCNMVINTCACRSKAC